MHLQLNSASSFSRAGIGGVSIFSAGSTAARILGMECCVEIGFFWCENLNKSLQKVKQVFQVPEWFKLRVGKKCHSGRIFFQASTVLDCNKMLSA
ncbi:hypothetical protein L0337_07050 [candidate division KSB1 bacterium]|nr:hypothetical protein [candidate division KSB1 bacterium]